MIEHKDIFGKDIQVGDYICYSAMDGQSPAMRVAKVVELKGRAGWNKEVTPTILVIAAENYFSDGPRPMSKKITLGFLNRLVVVPKSSISQEWLDAIELTGKWGPNGNQNQDV